MNEGEKEMKDRKAIFHFPAYREEKEKSGDALDRFNQLYTDDMLEIDHDQFRGYGMDRTFVSAA